MNVRHRERLTPPAFALAGAFLVFALPVLAFVEIVERFFAGPETISQLGGIAFAAGAGTFSALVALYSGRRLNVVDDDELVVRLWSSVPLELLRRARPVTGQRSERGTRGTRVRSRAR